MYDERLQGRTKKFQFIDNSMGNVHKHRETFNLTLRKNKMFDKMMDNRLNKNNNEMELSQDSTNTNDSQNLKNKKIHKYEGINVESVKLPVGVVENIEKQNIDFKVKTLIDWMKFNDTNVENSYKRYAVFHLRQLYQKYAIEYKKYLLTEEIIKFMMDHFTSEKDPSIKYEISFILTKITQVAKIPCSNEFCDVKFIQHLIQMSRNESIAVIENILIIIGNLSHENSDFIKHDTDYIIRLKEILSDDLSTMSADVFSSCNASNLPVVFLWNLNLIAESFSQEELNFFYDWIPNLLKFFNNNNYKLLAEKDKSQDVLGQLFKIFYNFTKNDDLIIYSLSSGLIKHLIYFLQFLNLDSNKNLEKDNLIYLNGDNLYKLIMLLTNIFATKYDIFIQPGELDSLIEIFENLLMRFRINHILDVEIIKEIVWCLSNMACFTNEREINQICYSKIPKLILTHYTKNESALEQSLHFFFNLLSNASIAGVVEIFKLNFIEKFCYIFKSFNKSEILMNCLHVINQIFKIVKEFQTEVNNGSVSYIIISEFEKNSLNTRLEQLSLHNDNGLSDYAVEILNNFDDLILDRNNQMMD